MPRDRLQATEQQKRMTYAGTFVFITEIHDLGLTEDQGMIITDSWYWSRDATTRSWSNRFFKKFNRMPRLYRLPITLLHFNT